MTTDRGYPWLKFYPTLLDDPKYLRMSDPARARYYELYLLAGKADSGGLLTAGDEIATVADLAIMLRLPEETLISHIEELIKSGLLVRESSGLMIKRFQEEQGPSQAEKREEWKKRQDKKRGKFTDQDQDQDQDKDKDKEEDKEVTRASRVTNKSNPLQKTAKEPEQSFYPLALVLSEVTGLSFEANKQRIFREAKLLSKDPAATPENIKADYGPRGTWYLSDWRGQKGQAPTLEQVRSTFGTLVMNKGPLKTMRTTGFEISKNTITQSIQEEVVNGY